MKGYTFYDTGKNGNLTQINFRNVPEEGITLTSGPLSREGIYRINGDLIIKDNNNYDSYVVNCIDIDWNECLVDANTTIKTTADLIRWIRQIVKNAGNFDPTNFSLDGSILYYGKQDDPNRIKIYDDSESTPWLDDLDWITTNMIKDNAITTPKLADRSVTEPKLADNAVSTRTIQNGAVTGDKLASGMLEYTPNGTSNTTTTFGTLKLGNNNQVNITYKGALGSGGIADLGNSEYIKEDSQGPKIGTLKLKTSDNTLLASIDIYGKKNETNISELNDLDDVTITNPSRNQILKYNGTKWVNGTGGTGGKAISAGTGINVEENDETVTVNLKKAASNEIGGIKLGYTTNDNEKNYKLQTDSSGNAFVNVPWAGSVVEGFEVKLSNSMMPVGTDSNGNVTTSFSDTCNVLAYVNNVEVHNFTVTTGTISRTNGGSISGINTSVSGHTISVTVSNSVTGFVGNSFIIPVKVTLTDSGINNDCSIVVYGVAAGDPGEDGGYYEIVYQNSYEAPTEPESAFTSEEITKTVMLANGWLESPTTPGIDENGKEEVTWWTKCFVTGNGHYGVWSTPARVSGANGTGFTRLEKEEFLGRQDEIDGKLDGLQTEIDGFKEEETLRIHNEVKNQLGDFNNLLLRYKDGKLLLNTPTGDDMHWDNDLNGYLQQVSLLEAVKNDNDETIGYQATYTKIEQTANEAKTTANGVRDSLIVYDENNNPHSRIENMLSSIDNLVNWTEDGGKAIGNLTTFYADSGVYKKDSNGTYLYDPNTAQVLNFVSSGFKAESDKYILKDGSPLYESLSQVFALYKGNNTDSSTKDELLAYIRAKVNSEEQLASAALVADTVMYEVKTQQAVDHTKNCYLYINSDREVLYKNGNTYYKLADDTEYSGNDIEAYMIPIRDEHGAFVYKLDTDSNGYLWTDTEGTKYTSDFSYDFVGSSFTLSDGNSSYNVELQDNGKYLIRENKLLYVTPDRIIRSHQWAGVLTESTLDSAFATLFALNKGTGAKAALTAWAIGNDTFLDAVAEKVEGGKAEITLAAMAKNEAMLYWDKSNSTWKGETPKWITSKYGSPDEVDVPGAFLKLAINEDNESTIKLDSDNLNISASDVKIGNKNLGDAIVLIEGDLYAKGLNSTSNNHTITIKDGSIVGKDSDNNQYFKIKNNGRVVIPEIHLMDGIGVGSHDAYITAFPATIKGDPNSVNQDLSANIVLFSYGSAVFEETAYATSIVCCNIDSDPTNQEVYNVSIGSSNFVYGTSFRQGSDITKKDIISDTTLTVEQIANAPAINFTWKDDPIDNKIEYVGTIALYWQTVLPLVVSEIPGGTMAMEYTNAAMVSSIITAREVVALKQENEDLKQRISQLEEWVNNLRNSLNN